MPSSTRSGSDDRPGTLAGPGNSTDYDSSATAINDQGQVVGFSDIVTNTDDHHYNHYHAFFYSAATGMVDISAVANGALGSGNSQASGINSPRPGRGLL